MIIESKLADFSRALCKRKISPTAHYILWRCGQSPLPRLTDIVEETGLTFPSVSFMVRRMTDGKLLARAEGYGTSLSRTHQGDDLYLALLVDAQKRKPPKTKKAKP